MINSAGIQKHVAFTANFLRFPSGHFTFQVLHRLLANPIKNVTGSWPAIYFPGGFTSHNQQYLDALAALDLTADTAWIDFHEDTAELPEIVRLSLRSLTGFVIGFEIPPSICRWLSTAGIPYMSFFVHPVRFLPDLLFAVSTNSGLVDSVLSAWSFDLAVAFEYASVLRALCIGDMAEQAFIKPDSALFIGQTAHDASIIKSGKMVGPLDHINDLQTLAELHADILIAPHPLERTSMMIGLLRQLKRGTLVNQNSYSLLSHENIATVVTLSSSLGVEAGFFGKNAIFLLGEPLRPGGPLVAGDAKVHAVGHCVLSTEFWAHILGFSAPGAAEKPHGGNSFRSPNLFRSLFGGWAYDQLDPVLRRKVAAERTNIQPRCRGKITYQELCPDRLDKIDFCALGNSLALVGDGFYDAESHGTWTDGHAAELLLPAAAISGYTAIRFRLYAFVNLLLPYQRVSVKVNGNIAGDFGIATDGEYHLSLKLPLPEAHTQYCRLRFEMPDAKSPLELGMSQDPRKLGLRFVEATLFTEDLETPITPA